MFKRRPERQRGGDAVANQRFAGDRLSVGQHAQRDLRSIAEHRRPECPSTRVPDLDDVARRGVRIGDIGAINPRMAAAEPLLATR